MWLSCVRTLRFISSDTLSAGDMVLLRPAGSLTARVLMDGDLAPQQVSTLLFSSPGTRLLPLSVRHVSAEPHALAATCPLGYPPLFPHPDERHVYFVDSFIRCSWPDNVHNTPHAHTKSHALLLFGHTPRWLITGCLCLPELLSILTVEGCGLTFTLLLVHFHQFN